MTVRDIQEQAGVAGRDVVAVIRTRHGGYDKHLHSKVLRPERYGITVIGETIDRLCEHFRVTPSDAPRKRKAENRINPCRLTCRVTEAEWERLQQYIREDGHDTVQAWLVQLVRRYIRRKDEKHGHIS